MLAAIEFDDQFLLETDEVGDIRTDRELAPKLVAEQGTVAQHRPKTSLRIGGLVPQVARKRRQRGLAIAHCGSGGGPLTPALSPRAGRGGTAAAGNRSPSYS